MNVRFIIDLWTQKTSTYRYMQPYQTHQLLNAEDATAIFEEMTELPFEFRKYKSYGKEVRVPRGQLAFSKDGIHYNYGKVAAGSPTVLPFDDNMTHVCNLLEAATGQQYNTILANYYKNGDDYISPHQDRDDDWVEGSGFATVSFGCTRDFVLKCESERHVIPHVSGMAIYCPYPTNKKWTHAVPKRKGVSTGRISLTFRHIRDTSADTHSGADPV